MGKPAGDGNFEELLDGGAGDDAALDGGNFFGRCAGCGAGGGSGGVGD